MRMIRNGLNLLTTCSSREDIMSAEVQTEYEARIFAAEMKEDGQPLIGIRLTKYELLEFDEEGLVPTIFMPLDDAVGLGVSIIQAATITGTGEEDESAE